MAAQIPNNSPATGLDTVLEVLNDVVRKSGGGNYIYRGERSHASHFGEICGLEDREISWEFSSCAALAS